MHSLVYLESLDEKLHFNLALSYLLFERAKKEGLAKVTFNEISTDQSDSTTQILGSNLCVVSVIAYLPLKDILKAWRLEGDTLYSFSLL